MSAPARRRLAGALAFLVLAGLAAAIVSRPSAPAAAPDPCRPAVLVDGRLACGPEAQAIVARACPAANLVLHDGDAVRTLDACASGVQRMEPAMLRALGVVIDVDAASVADLRSLPGVGPVLAQRIVEGRPYSAVDDLARVRGIGPVTLARLRPRVRVGVQPPAQ